MKLICLFIISLFLFTSCGSSKKARDYSSKTVVTNTNKTNRIVTNAKSYIGTKYRYGGITKKGMDCSGLVYTAFKNNNVSIPRTSFEMSRKGTPVKRTGTKKGDLLFFKTSKTGRSINHVGLVTKVINKTIYFVHSSSSKGVIESNLNNSYWNKAYRFTKRVL